MSMAVRELLYYLRIRFYKYMIKIYTAPGSTKLDIKHRPRSGQMVRLDGPRRK